MPEEELKYQVLHIYGIDAVGGGVGESEIEAVGVIDFVGVIEGIKEAVGVIEGVFEGVTVGVGVNEGGAVGEFTGTIKLIELNNSLKLVIFISVIFAIILLASNKHANTLFKT